MPNAIALLKSDHVAVRKLLRELEGTTERGIKARERLVADIEREIKIHSQIEEELFYPTFKKAAEDTKSEELFYEATEEHHVVDLVLPALKSTNPKSPEFAAKAKVLKDLAHRAGRHGGSPVRAADGTSACGTSESTAVADSRPRPGGSPASSAGHDPRHQVISASVRRLGCPRWRGTGWRPARRRGGRWRRVRRGFPPP